MNRDISRSQLWFYLILAFVSGPALFFAAGETWAIFLHRLHSWSAIFAFLVSLTVAVLALRKAPELTVANRPPWLIEFGIFLLIVMLGIGGLHLGYEPQDVDVFHRIGDSIGPEWAVEFQKLSERGGDDSFGAGLRSVSFILHALVLPAILVTLLIFSSRRNP